ncbi:MAG: cytochrome c, class I, partial [bacterium]
MSKTRSVLLSVAGGLALACVLAGLLLSQTLAQSSSLGVSDRGSKTGYSRQDLLRNPALRDVTIIDPVRRGTMTYRALPMAELLKGLKIGADDYVQARATDNFSIGIPARLFKAPDAGQAEAFLAVENPAAPWPALPKASDKSSGGPFYLIWRVGPSGHVSQEYWVYRLASFEVTDGPLKRWPGLAVAADVPAADPIRTGLDRFVELCISCHRFNGNGEGEQGPDLSRPMNPVEYYQIPALKKLIRDPASVRKWPDQKMPGFDRAALSDYDLDAL